MAEIHQKERADAYYREMVAMLAGETARYNAYSAKNGHDDLTGADHRLRIRTLLSTVESVESGDFHHALCEACGNPLVNGDWVLTFADTGDVHADCGSPTLPSTLLGSHIFDDCFGVEECAQILARAKVTLAEVENYGVTHDGGSGGAA